MSGVVDAYVGPDRRQRFARAVHEPSRRLLLTIALAVLLYGIAIPTVVAELLGPDRSVSAADIATISCAILFAQGGLLLLLQWRLSGDARICLLGVAALVYGFFVVPSAEVFKILSPGDQQVALQAVAQSIVGIVAAVLALRSAVTRPVNSTLHPVRSVALAVGVLVALSGAAYAGSRAVGEGSQARFGALLAVIAAAAWLGAAAAVLGRGRADRRTFHLLSAPYVVLGLGSMCGALSLRTPVPFSLDASALTMSAGVLLAGGAAYVLLTMLSNQGASAFRLRALLRNLEQYRANEEERTHDARSALLAVQTAITALTRYRERLDDQSRTNLELAVDSELERLVGLMASPSPGVRIVDRQPFDVVQPVVAVATAMAAFGVTVELDVPERGCWALGSRDDTARVLESLLDNARRYASGSPITVRVAGAADRVTVVVSDRGPGIDLDEREAVFGRGRRGRASHRVAGTGLGLFAARRLMEDQDGALALAASGPPGATFVVTLGAAPQPASVASTAGDGRPRRSSPRTLVRRPIAPPAWVAAGRAVGGSGPIEAA